MLKNPREGSGILARAALPLSGGHYSVDKVDKKDPLSKNFDHTT